ncbi:MAG TPA: hypothetical protein VGH11_07485 [Jatrophihabitans sp.]|jgi:hypothetical protein
MADESVENPRNDTEQDPDAADQSGEGPAQDPSLSPHPRRRYSAGPVLPQSSKDDSDLGWGDEPSRRTDDWYERERPPHHG